MKAQNAHHMNWFLVKTKCEHKQERILFQQKKNRKYLMKKK